MHPLLQSHCLALALVLASLPPVVLAANKSDAAGAAKAPKKKSTKVKIIKSETGESTAERIRRMQLECRGLPNAGACRGYGWGS